MKRKNKPKEIIALANKRHDEIVESAKGDGREEGERMKAVAQADIEQHLNQAREQLRSDVVRLSLIGAEQVLGAAVDANAHNASLEKLAAEL